MTTAPATSGEGTDAVLHVGSAVRILSDGQRSTEVEIRNLRFAGGSVSAICGPRGIGKSTALELLSLSERPDRYEDLHLFPSRHLINVSAMLKSRSDAAITRLRGTVFGYVLQTNRLIPYLSVRENIEVSQIIAGQADSGWVDELMQALDIGSLQDSRASDLSGGQRQRICLARAMAHKPAILLADEPTSAVDSELGDVIFETLKAYATRFGAAVVVITHNQALVSKHGLAELPIRTRTRDKSLHTLIGPADVQGIERGEAAL